MGSGFFLSGWGLGFTVYVVMQSLAVLLLNGNRRRGIVLLPALLMTGVLLWTLYAHHAGSNLWPIVLIFASVFSIIAVVAVGFVLWLEQRRELVLPQKPSSAQ